jgi:hypothetical protein
VELMGNRMRHFATILPNRTTTATLHPKWGHCPIKSLSAAIRVKRYGQRHGHNVGDTRKSGSSYLMALMTNLLSDPVDGHTMISVPKCSTTTLLEQEIQLSLTRRPLRRPRSTRLLSEAVDQTDRLRHVHAFREFC